MPSENDSTIRSLVNILEILSFCSNQMNKTGMDEPDGIVNFWRYDSHALLNLIIAHIFLFLLSSPSLMTCISSDGCCYHGF